MPTDNPMLNGVYELIEWAFMVVLDERDRDDLRQEIMSGWDDGDPSEQVLVLGMLQGWASLSQLPVGFRDAQRPAVLGELYAAMAQPRPDDCGRVLFRLQELLSRQGVQVPNPAAARRPESDASYEQRVAAARAEQAGYHARVSNAMSASYAGHQAQVDALMRIGGWERVY
jgi:hypothetical protein